MLGVNESNPNSSLKKKKEKTKAFDFNFLLKFILLKAEAFFAPLTFFHQVVFVTMPDLYRIFFE